MKNKENKSKSTIIKDTLALFLITLISGLALSYVYEVTKEPIKAMQEQKKVESYQRAYPEAASFEEDQELMDLAAATDLSTLNPAFQGSAIEEVSKAFDGSGNVIGYLMKISTKKGYNKSTPITLAVAYANDGTLKGIDVISLKETVNLGADVAEPYFKDQFANKQVPEFSVTKTGSKADNEIDAISGATISSKAVTNAVNAGIAFISQNGGGVQ